MSADFFVESVSDGRSLVITGKWSRAAESLVVSGQVDDVALSYVEGFSESSLDFLIGLPIRRLFVIARWLEDVVGIETLGSTLKRLYLDVSPKAQLDLSKLSLMEDLSVSGRILSKNLDYVGSARWKKLRVDGWQNADLTSLAAMQDVEELYLWNRSRLKSLSGIEQWSSLRVLSVYASQLRDISALGSESLRKLEKLDLEGCKKVDRLDPLANLRNLHELNIGNIGLIESLKPISALPHLRKLFAYESTNVLDGDLIPLLDLTGLEALRLMSRRHYRPSVDDVKARLGILE